MAVFNSGVRGKRAKDGAGVIGTHNQFVQKEYPVPSITTYTVTGIDDTALDPAGGQTVIVTGYGFAAGMTGIIGGTSISVLTVVSPTQVTFTSPAKTAGSYALTLANTNGSAAILVPGLTYSSVPTWTTSAGPLASIYETTAINSTLVATSDSSITYTQVSGDLPPGATLASDGTITGTAPVSSGATTYEFTVKATDAELQDVLRTFIITVNTDVVTWSTPASGQSYTLVGGSPMTNVTLSATSAAGYDVSYSANALPTGVSLSSNTISGTPTVAENITTLLTATAATTNRTATRTISWSVSLGDLSWKNVTLLLNGSTPTTTFINDASLNNSQLTIFGDTKPNNFNPYEEGYYSVQLNGTVNDYVSIPTNTGLSIMSGSTNTFVAECWVYWNVVTAYQVIMDKSGRNGVSFQNWAIELDGSKQIKLVWGASGTPGTSAIGQLATTTIPVPGQWYHIALVKSSADWSVFVNGVRGVTFNGLNTANDGNPAALRIGLGIDGEYNGGYMNGYVSNVRVYNGTAGSAPYSATATTITVPAAPLTPISTYTYAITNQSPRYVDNSVIGATITPGTGAKISSVQPFATPTTVAYNTQYSTTFDGTGDYLSLSGTMSAIGTNDFTVEMWIQVRTSGTYNVLDFTSSGSNGAYLNFYLSSMTPALYVNSANRITGGAALNVGQWYHVAISRVTGNTRMFIDGTQSGSTWADTTSYLSPANRPVLCTSGNNIGANYMPGLISNLRIINGTGLYSGNFTPSTSPLTAVSGTSLLTCQNSTLKDNSTNNFTITSYADARPVAVSPFTMTTSNLTVTSLGSAYFDGTGDWLSIPYSPAFSTGATFTFEAWVYPTAFNSGNMIFQITNPTITNFGGWLLELASTGEILFNSRPGNGGTNVQLYSGLLKLNTWAHVALSVNSNSVKIFQDGVQVGTTTVVALDGTQGHVAIGAITNGYTTVPFTGYISDVRLVKGTALYTSNFLPPQTPLTPVANTQLLALQYNGGANNNGFVDQSSFNNIITRNGNTTQGTFSPYSQTGWSSRFSNANYVYHAANTNYDITGGDYTIEFWINWNTMNTMASSESVIATTYTSTVGWYIAMTNGTSSTFPNMKFGAYNGSWTYATNTSLNNTSMPPNQWHHIAIVRSGSGAGNLTFYLNGTPTGGTYNAPTYAGAGGGLYYGVYAQNLTYSGNPNYLLSNFRIVKGTAIVPPSGGPTESLQPVTNTVVLTHQDNRFIDNSSLQTNMTVVTANSVTPSVQAFSPFGGVTVVPTGYSYKLNTGDVEGCVYFPDNAALRIGTNQFTMECWVNLTQWVNGSAIIATKRAYNSTGTGSWIFYIGTNGAVAFDQLQTPASIVTTASGAVTTGSWYHLALTRDSSNVVRIYVNGVNSGTTTPTSTFNFSSTEVFYVGKNNDGGNYKFIGRMSNFRLVNGTALYTGASNITVPTTTLTAVANTALLTYYSNTVEDGSVNRFVPVVLGPGVLTATTVNPFGTTTVTSQVMYSSNVNGGSMYFDGTGDYLTTATGLTYTDLTQGEFTAEAWIYNQGAGAERYIYSQRGSGSGWEMRINAGNTLSFFYTGGTTFTSGGTIPANAWTHIAVVRIGTALSMYINGTRDATGSGTIANGSTASASYGVWLGYGTTGGGLMLGYISDARLIKGTGLYKSNFVPAVAPLPAISGTTYLLNGSSGGILDYHSSNNLETVGNTQLASEDPYSGSYYSNYFDGSGDYLTLPSNQAAFTMGTGDFTIEMWVNVTSFAAGRTFYDTMNSGDSTGTGRFALQLSTGGVVQIFTGAGSIFTSGGTLVAGTWAHIAYVRISNSGKLYINGVQVNTTYTDNNNYVVGATSRPIIGVNAYDNSSNPMFGYISNLRVVKGSGVYTSNFTPSTAPLTAISGTSLLTCQSNTFKDNSTNNFTITRNGDTKIKSINPFQNNTGKSLYFNGTSNALLFPGSSVPTGAGSAFTFEFWIYPTTLASVILRCLGNASSFAIMTNASGQIILTNTFIADFLTATGGAVTVNSWNYVAITRTAANLYTVYLNGNSVGSATYNTALGEQPMYIGFNYYSSSYQNYYIKDLRITKGVVRTITVPTSPLEAK